MECYQAAKNGYLGRSDIKVPFTESQAKMSQKVHRGTPHHLFRPVRRIMEGMMGCPISPAPIKHMR